MDNNLSLVVVDPVISPVVDKKGFDDAIKKIGSVQNKFSDVIKVVNNVKGRINDTIKNVGDVTKQIGSIVASNLGTAFSSVTAISKVIGKGLVLGIKYNAEDQEGIQSLTGQLTTLKENALSLLGDMTMGLTDQLTNGVLPIALQSVDTLKKAFEENGTIGVAQALGGVLSNLVTYVADNAPQIVSVAVAILSALITGLQENAPQIINGVISIIQTLVNGIITLLPQLAEVALDIILQLGSALASYAPELVPSIIQLIIDFVNFILDNMPRIFAVAGDLISGLAIGLINSIPTLLAAIPQIVFGLVNAFISYKHEVSEIGSDIIRGIWEGIQNFTGWLTDKIKSFASDVVGSIKDFFGIHSPSRVMRDEVGKYLAQGIGEGFVKNIPVKQMTANMKKAIDQMQQTAIRVTSNVPMTAKIASKSVTENYTNNTIDYNAIENAQLRAMNKANERPVLLNGRQINRELRDWGYATR